MSAGTILQLVAKGEQDVLLSANPDLNQFKSVYKRHVSFASEMSCLPFNESSSEFVNRKLTCVIPKKADLLQDVYLYVELPALTIPSGSTKVYWTNTLGFAMIKEVYIEIGDFRIDKKYGEWMYIWHELITHIPSIENDPAVYGFSTITGLESNADSNIHLQVPLYFWFHSCPELALPLIALQFHEVKITVEIRDFLECVCYDGPTPPDRVNFEDIHLNCHFTYLEEETRKKFARNEHVFLIEQLQQSNYETIPAGSDKISFDLTLNHPVKEMFWFLRETESEANNDWLNFTQRVPLFTKINPLAKSFTLLLDGKERFNTVENHFRELQKLKNHRMMSLDYSYIFSFSLTPEDCLQPRGSCNFSRISSAQLKCTTNPDISFPECTFVLYGANYNYLYIKNGQANVFYKN